jgi:hypothetical protein
MVSGRKNRPSLLGWSLFLESVVERLVSLFEDAFCRR